MQKNNFMALNNLYCGFFLELWTTFRIFHDMEIWKYWIQERVNLHELLSCKISFLKLEIISHKTRHLWMVYLSPHRYHSSCFCFVNIFLQYLTLVREWGNFSQISICLNPLKAPKFWIVQQNEPYYPSLAFLHFICIFQNDLRPLEAAQLYLTKIGAFIWQSRKRCLILYNL